MKNCLISCFHLNEELVNFMNQLRRLLNKLNYELIIISHARPKNLSVPIIVLPYSFPEYHNRYSAQGIIPSDEFKKTQTLLIKTDQLFGGESSRQIKERRNGFYICAQVLEDIVYSLKPSIGFVWGTSHPQSQLLKFILEKNSIPSFILERGLFPETLMFESSGYGIESDLNRDLSFWHEWQNKEQNDTYQCIKTYYLEKKPQKYSQDNTLSADEIRESLQIKGKKIAVFWGQHDIWSGIIPRESTKSKIISPFFMSNADALSSLKDAVHNLSEIAILFKPHPHDNKNYSEFQDKSIHVIKNVDNHTLFDLADIFIAMTTTTQFEGLFYEKPLILMANSQLKEKDVAYEYDHTVSLESMIKDALQKNAFETKLKNSKIFISGLFENFLYGTTHSVPTENKISEFSKFIVNKGKDAEGSHELIDSNKNNCCSPGSIIPEIIFPRSENVPRSIMLPEKQEVKNSNQISEKTDVKLIAFYLPQFHPIQENDLWWGKGFTEWTDVAKAQPLFPGHYQPHLPTDLGFYDLRLPEARKAQADLAREYGIHGFCYHHYWFNGKLLLEKPLQEILKSGKPDFPFCICWNNGDWPRVSDRADEILIEQIYSEEDDRNHIRYLCEFFQDKRYIRVDGKPLLLVHRANHLPDPLKTASIWREEARVLGIGELYLCRVESSSDEYGDPKGIGFDASVELQPDKANLGQRLEDPLYEGHPVYRYQDFVRNVINKKDPPYLRFPCVTPSWDNSPKQGKDSAILTDSSPQLYEEWLKSAIERIGGKEENERIVFINAWNEWGEGNHLEPDLKHGRGYLKATSSALYDLEESVTEDTIQTKYKAIESMIESGKEDQAMAALEELLSIDPDHALAHNDLGVLFFHKGNAEGALRHLEKAARIKPDHLDILKNLADIYLQADRSEDAVATYEKVLSIIPEDVESLLVMGALMHQLNRSGKAAYFFRKALDVDSDNVQAKEHLLLLEGEKDHAQHIAAEGKVLKVGLLLATKDDPEYNGFVATGLGYVAANLRKSLPQVTVFFKERVEDMLREEPDLIGISSVTEDYYIAIQMAEAIKKHRNLPVVLGGIHISLIPESLKPCFDLGVIGEGEITFVEVVNTLLQEHELKPEALKDIPGIVFWDQGQLVKTPPREILNDLDSLPEPVLEELPYYRSSTVACLVSARGCPYHCTFCASEKFARTYRSFSTKRILDTIEDLVWNKNISHIVFYDDLLIANKKKISDLVAGLEQRGLLGKCSFSCQVRANVVDDEICSLLRKMNVVDTGMGIESFSDKILRYYNKSGVTAKVNQRALDILHRHGIKANPSIIFAAPPETREDMLITFRKVYENIREGKINTVAWGILRPYPGTKIWEYAEARGIVGKDMDWNRFSNWSTFDNYLCETVPAKEFYEMMDEWRAKNSLVRKPGSGYSNFWINDPVELYCKIDDLKESIRTRTEPELGDDLVLARETTIDNPLFAEGWYEPEKDKSRWMKQSARLIFKNEQKKRFAFLFYVQPEVFKRVYQDSLELKVFDSNERLMFQKQYTAENFGTGLHSIQFRIPRNQDVCLDIRFDKSMIPAEHGLGGDDRRMSVLVKRVFTIGKAT